MNLLELCSRVRQECGIAGTGPITTTNQVGVLGKIVSRTINAWVDIQALRPYWKFLRAQKQYALTIGKRTYSVTDDLLLPTKDKWDQPLSYIFQVDTNDESRLVWYDYSTFRSRFRTFQSGRPSIICEDLTGNLSFNTVPDIAYTITLDYWMTPELLANDADVPAMPEQYHSAIVWKSVMMFAGNETASELYVYAKSMYTPVYNALVLDQGELPTTVRNYPLAVGARRHHGPFPRPIL